MKQHWDVTVLGINYDGDPTDFGYPVYPALRAQDVHTGGDFFGVHRVQTLMRVVEPDVVVLLNDPWNIPQYVEQIRGVNPAVPVIGSLAVDAKNCSGKSLEDLQLAIFWTEFGRHEAEIGGFRGNTAVIPLGVDLSVFRPIDKAIARSIFSVRDAVTGDPIDVSNAFIVGNVNRNQPRKRHDLLIQYFAEWVRRYKIPDAYLFFHVAPTGDVGWDLTQLMKYYGVDDRIIRVTPGVRHGVPDETLAHEYNSFDVMVTAACEGWGLPHLEGMACGIPQIVPDWSALGDWPGDAAIRIPCSSTYVTPNLFNTVMGIPDRAEVIAALQTMYTNKTLRADFGIRGMVKAGNPSYNWKNIGAEYDRLITQVVEAKTGAAAHVG
jgi:D-inositol-3-phosphate glycosyltransferase